MPSAIELRAAQKTLLFDLRKVKRDDEKAGLKLGGLVHLILKTEAAMEAEDVAWVEKKIAELD